MMQFAPGWDQPDTRVTSVDENMTWGFWGYKHFSENDLQGEKVGTFSTWLFTAIGIEEGSALPKSSYLSYVFLRVGLQGRLIHFPGLHMDQWVPTSLGFQLLVEQTSNNYNNCTVRVYIYISMFEKKMLKIERFKPCCNLSLLKHWVITIFETANKYRSPY